MNIFDEAKSLSNRIIEHRRYLHKNAEVGFDLPITAEYIEGQLQGLGLNPKRIAKCGVIADIGPADNGYILLRADTDALPIKEESGLPFSSQSKHMHACGHDIHAAMLLGAAEIIASRKDRITYGIRLLFQPAEELLEGAMACIDEGVLDNVVAAFMLHTLTNIPLPTGSIIISSAGISAPAADFFKITVEGKRAHGAMPNEGIDAIYAAANIIQTICHIKSNILAPSDPSAITIGKIHGGDAANVIAERAVIEGTLRAPNEDSRTRIKENLERLATSMASSIKAESSVDYTRSCPSLFNDKDLSSYAKRVLSKSLDNLYMSDDLRKATQPLSGSEDFAYIAKAVPSLMIGLCCGNPNEGYIYPLHHSKCIFSESSFWLGAAIYASLALKYKNKEDS